MQPISAWVLFSASGIMMVGMAMAIVGAATKSKSSLNGCVFCCLLAAVIVFGSFPWAAAEDRKVTMIAGTVCAAAGLLVWLWARKMPEELGRFD